MASLDVEINSGLGDGGANVVGNTNANENANANNNNDNDAHKENEQEVNTNTIVDSNNDQKHLISPEELQIIQKTRKFCLFLL
jgi:hypothetical protein